MTGPESLDFKVSEFEWFPLLFHDFFNLLTVETLPVSRANG